VILFTLEVKRWFLNIINRGKKFQSAHRQARKDDEFYTQLIDIENELRHYKEHFKGKVVYCNCDDPRVSKFFEFYGLKRLIADCWPLTNS